MRIKLPYGNTDGNNKLVLPNGQLTFDMEGKALRVHDGVTPGGIERLGIQAWYPTAGDLWYNSQPTTSGVLTADSEVCAKNNILLTVRDNLVHRSVDNGMGWTPVAIGNGNTAIRAPGVLNEHFVCFTVTPFSGKPKTITVYRSLDGLSWSTSTISNDSNSRDVSAMVYFNSVYYISSGERIFKSMDLINWTAVITTPNYLPVLVISGNRLYGIGKDRTAYTEDGVTWTAAASNLGISPTHGTIHDGVFYASTAVGMQPIRVSSDGGVSWTEVTLDIDPKYTTMLSLLIVDKYHFLRVHTGTTPNEGAVYRTEDMMTFTKVDTHPTYGVLTASDQNLYMCYTDLLRYSPL